MLAGSSHTEAAIWFTVTVTESERPSPLATIRAAPVEIATTAPLRGPLSAAVATAASRESQVNVTPATDPFSASRASAVTYTVSYSAANVELVGVSTIEAMRARIALGELRAEVGVPFRTA